MDYIQATDEVLAGLDELEHYGVKDMSWYKHKFGKWQEQAKYARGHSVPQVDGAEVVLKDSRNEKESVLKKAGDAMKKASQERKDRQAQEAIAVKRKAQSEKMLAAKKAKAEERARVEKEKQEWLRDPKKLQEHLFDFTDEEIQSAMRRFQWEDNLATVNNNRIAQGKRTVDTYLGYADTAIRSYNTLARVVNTVMSVNKDDDEYFQLPYVPSGDRSKQVQDIRGARAAAANLRKANAETANLRRQAAQPQQQSQQSQSQPPAKQEPKKDEKKNKSKNKSKK